MKMKLRLPPAEPISPISAESLISGLLFYAPADVDYIPDAEKIRTTLCMMRKKDNRNVKNYYSLLGKLRLGTKNSEGARGIKETLEHRVHKALLEIPASPADCGYPDDAGYPGEAKEKEQSETIEIDYKNTETGNETYNETCHKTYHETCYKITQFYRLPALKAHFKTDFRQRYGPRTLYFLESVAEQFYEKLTDNYEK